MINSVTWAELKALVSSKALKMQYQDLTSSTPQRYFIWANENDISYQITLLVGTDDCTDFINNYKDDCNLPINSLTIDGSSSNRYASEGDTITDMDTYTDIDIVDGWVEMSSITYNDGGFLVTDASMSSNKNGTFRFCIAGNPIKYIYYNAKDYIAITRNLPYYIPAGYKMSIEFKTDEDGASVSTCLGGIKNG